jgi:hypothetical protein
MLGIKLLIGGVQLLEIFTLCDLDSFEAIIRNTFLDAYELDISSGNKKLEFMPKLALS